MKRVFLSIAFILFLIISFPVFAQKAPEGFLDIKWGTTKEEIMKMLGARPSDSLDFYRILDMGDRIHFNPGYNIDSDQKWHRIGEVMVTEYNFSFSKLGKFYKASVNFPKITLEPPHNFDILLNALTTKYGSPKRTTPLVLKINPKARVGTQYEWIIENKVEITLWYNDMEQMGINGTLVYTYLPIMREIEKKRDKDVAKTRDKL